MEYTQEAAGGSRVCFLLGKKDFIVKFFLSLSFDSCASSQGKAWRVWRCKEGGHWRVCTAEVRGCVY